ncbi:methyltransferase domain-containing protein [Nannocystaceae bacterium ST9]
MRRHSIRVGPLPEWLDAQRLLGPTHADDPDARGWTFVATAIAGTRQAEAELDGERASDLAARLRGLVIAGHPIVTEIEPALARTLVRAGRLADARRRRATSVGFERRGVQLDDEGRWSLTPEALALAIGRSARRARVIDAGCGVGGNAIGFARAGCEVIAIDVSRERLAMARHNAGIYGVGEQIRFVHGDALALVGEFVGEGTIVFVDPPWGRDWAERELHLADMPLLAGLRELAEHRRAALWAKLPAAFPVAELGGAPEAVFGVGEGDLRRIKFLLVRRDSLRGHDEEIESAARG